MLALAKQDVPFAEQTDVQTARRLTKALAIAAFLPGWAKEKGVPLAELLACSDAEGWVMFAARATGKPQKKAPSVQTRTLVRGLLHFTGATAREA